MPSFSRDYVGSKAPGAAFAIILTLGVNVALFAILGWVNKRDVVREPESPTFPSRQAFAIPRPPDAERQPKKNVKKLEAKKTVEKAPTDQVKPKKVRPQHPRQQPTMPAIRASIPSMTLDLKGNLALPMGDDFSAQGPPLGDTPTGDIASNDGVDQPAKAVYAPPPAYPLSAKRLNHEGNVGIKLIITASGQPRDTTIASSSGHRSLDDSALKAVQRWRFSPAIDNGEKVAVRGEVTIVFKLEE